MTVRLDKNRFAYTVAEGTVYVAIRAAEKYSYYDTERGPVEGYDPRVELTTDPTGDRDNPGYVKIRGRRYRIHTFHKRVRERAGWVDRHGQPIRWSGESDPYRGGFRNDTDTQVGYETKAQDRLRDIEREVLELFEADQPGWRHISERQALEAEHARWEYKATRAREELADFERHITALAEAIAAH